MLKKGKKIAIRIDMTPMVDVIILLLIFFFMTSRFAEPEAVEVTLPEAAAGVKIPTGVNVIIVEADGVVYLNNRQVDRDQLNDGVKAIRMTNPNARFVIKCDRDADFGIMLTIFKDMQAVRATRMILSTLKETGQWLSFALSNRIPKSQHKIKPRYFPGALFILHRPSAYSTCYSSSAPSPMKASTVFSSICISPMR